MKVLSGIFALTLAFHCLAAPAPVKDDYTELAETVLQYAKQEMSKLDPTTIPNSQSKMQNQNISCYINQTNRLSGHSIFVVEKIVSDPANMSVEAVIQMPNLIRSGSYKLNGEAYGRKVQGEGEYIFRIEGLRETLKATFIHPEINVQLLSFNVTYEIPSIKIEMPGLTIEGMTPQEVQNFVDTEMTAIIIRDLNDISKNAGRTMKRAFNPTLKPRTLKDVIAWAKSSIKQ